LLVIAAPGIRDFVLMQRLKAIHAQLVTDLQFARSEAVGSGSVVNLRVQPPPSATSMSCYVVFNHFSHDYRLNGASEACDCTRAPGNRCLAANTREIRTVQIPRSRQVTLDLSQSIQSVAFDPRTGGMMLMANESGAVRGANFVATARIDNPRSLSISVGISGRPAVCRLPTSTLSGTEC
jgi:hypothetical protein